MLELPAYVFAQHNLSLVAVAFAVLVGGSFLSLNLFNSASRASGMRLYIWAVISSIVAAGTLWTTHFLCMLSFDPEIEYGYVRGVPSKALLIGIFIMAIGFLMAARARRTAFVELGGAVVGLGLCVMHSISLTSYKVQGRLDYDLSIFSVGMAGAIIFSILFTNRISRSVTRYCKYGSVLALVLAFVMVHGATLLAMNITPDSATVLPETLVRNEGMLLGVMSRLISVMGLGLIAYALDYYGTQDVLERFRHLAHHDPLTGLPNRRRFNEMLSGVLLANRNKTSKVAVVTFDLNRFKDINDVHSHSAGDYVLQTVASRLQQVLGDDEFVARIGGDEFVAYKETVVSKDQAKAFADKLKRAVIERVDWSDRSLNVGSSIGIALYPDDGVEVDDLLGKADLAMYRAKRTVSNGIAHYDARLDEARRDKSAISMDIRHAIERGEFELVYQPQNKTSDRSLIGFEVLLRWNHPERGVVTPDMFIPVAERDGYIKIIGEWVLREACREAARWTIPTKIAVNVAASQLAGTSLPRIVREALVEAGLPARLLELEITESGIISDPSHAETIVRELKEIGVSIAMDDFGTGYSSLNTLQTFPFDKIKIDKTFINGINNNPQSEAIVKSTVKLGEWLNITVLAEGVETEEQLRFLNDIGCKQLQGYLCGKPTSDPQLSLSGPTTNVIAIRA